MATVFLARRDDLTRNLHGASERRLRSSAYLAPRLPLITFGVSRVLQPFRSTLLAPLDCPLVATRSLAARRPPRRWACSPLRRGSSEHHRLSTFGTSLPWQMLISQWQIESTSCRNPCLIFLFVEAHFAAGCQCFSVQRLFCLGSPRSPIRSVSCGTLLFFNLNLCGHGGHW